MNTFLRIWNDIFVSIRMLSSYIYCVLASTGQRLENIPNNLR